MGGCLALNLQGLHSSLIANWTIWVVPALLYPAVVAMHIFYCITAALGLRCDSSMVSHAAVREEINVPIGHFYRFGWHLRRCHPVHVGNFREFHLELSECTTTVEKKIKCILAVRHS